MHVDLIAPMPILDDLNQSQREAVLTTEGPLLVLAGAGTGKTRVITYRVAHLIEQGIPGNSILAVTFTNKAADVMKTRIDALLRSTGHDAAGIWVSTFHSFCARLLRREAAAAGLPRDFAIYDDDDQTAAVKRALLVLDLPAEVYPPRSIRSQISHAKNHGITPGEMEAEAGAARNDERKRVAQLFRAYNDGLRKAGAVDFDDLLLLSVQLLRDNAQIRAAWSSRFQYLMVDEFQDTNRWQEELVRLLAGTHKNICVVGDEDQSIYGWRGARAGNMKRFTEDFPNAKIIRLEDNYRSTQTILDAAAAVVGNNRNRLGKHLVASAGAGAPLRYYEAQDANTEAEYVSTEIASILREDRDAKVAVLYRTGSQSRAFEEALRHLGIRYRVVGGFSFYERAEVRNALAYIRLLFHPEDNVALLRVLNVPPRGIGATSIAALEERARDTDRSLWDIIREGDLVIARRVLRAFSDFRDMIVSLQQQCADLSPSQLIEKVLDGTGYLTWIEQQDNLEHTSRADNLRELSNAMAEATEAGQTLEDVLDHAALVAGADDYDESVGVSLMTLHSAKGLEFDAVYLAGLEEGVLPHSRSINDDGDVEEERRLFYVGMTRARRTLVLTRALYRRSYGEDRLRAALPSRFIAEIPGEMIEAAPGSYSDPGESRRYEDDPEFSHAPSQRTAPGHRYGYGRSAPGSRMYGNRGKAGYDARAAEAARLARGSSGDPLIGKRVRHSKYGIGTIIKIEGEGDDRKITVSFIDYGPKKLVERYANLQLA
jgi:DNA helicase-2/ATP-dependent DNA helicase PcrA